MNHSLPESLTRGFGAVRDDLPEMPPLPYCPPPKEREAQVGKPVLEECLAALETREIAQPLKTPTEWAALSGVRIIDIDGWRSPDEKDFSLPVTQEEFDGRVIRCTVQIVDWEKFRHPMMFIDYDKGSP